MPRIKSCKTQVTCYVPKKHAEDNRIAKRLKTSKHRNIDNITQKYRNIGVIKISKQTLPRMTASRNALSEHRKKLKSIEISKFIKKKSKQTLPRMSASRNAWESPQIPCSAARDGPWKSNYQNVENIGITSINYRSYQNIQNSNVWKQTLPRMTASRNASEASIFQCSAARDAAAPY